MSVAKSGLIVLLLAIPFGLYAAWQVRELARGDFGVSGAPGDKLPDRDHFADRRAKAETFSRDVRKAAAVAIQFRTPEAGDKTADPECDAVAAAAAKRSAVFIDLERFLAGVRNPGFTSELKERFKSWYDETEALRVAAFEVEKWFDDREPVVGSQATADAEMKRFNDKLEAYTKGRSIFVDRGLVAGWRVRAAARIITALANTVKAPYERVLDLPLPLPSESRSVDVKTAIGALAEMKVQEARLEDLAANARASGIALPKNAETAKAAAIQKAREWAAADQLLALFADPELFTEPNKATTWLPKVQGQFARMQTEGGKELIRKKVQQFCDAYIPRAARLDAEVLIQGKREPRKGVTIEYDSDAKSQPLSEVTDKLNEFNFKAMHKGFDRIVWSNGNRFTGDAGALRPTPRSIAARDFTRARAGMTEWTPASINQLKMKCEAGLDALQLEERHRLLDELIGAGEGPEWTQTNTRIWTRLTALSTAMEKHRVLFEAKKQ